MRPSVVRIHIDDFAKAQAEHPDLNSITDVCTFQSIDDCWRWHFYKKGDGFEMYFDQGEPFYGHAVERQRHGRHAKDYRHLTSVLIEEVNMRTCPGIQAADLFTWAVSHAEASAPWPWYRELLAIHRDEQIFHYADLLHPSAETLTKLKQYKFSKRKTLNRKAQEPVY